MTTQLNTIYNFKPTIFELSAKTDPENLISLRIFDTAVPLFCMIRGYGHSALIEVLSGLHMSFLNVCEIKRDAKTGLTEDVKEKANPELAMLALNITSIGLLYLNPYAVTLVTQTKAIYASAILLGKHVANKKYMDALKESVNIADKCIFSASLLTGAPQLIVISNVSRSIFEMYKAKQFYDQGMYIIASILTALSGLRCSAIAKTYKTEIADFVQDFRANTLG